MRVAPEGGPFIIIAWMLALILAVFAPLWVFLAWLPIALWVVAFFRDPVREGPRGEDVVIAPADGLVVYWGDVRFSPDLQGPRSARTLRAQPKRIKE